MKLIAKNISKSIKGRCILNHIDLELEGGKVYGFIGRNGSGKTMLFRALSGLMSVDSGSIALDGIKLGEDVSVLPGLGLVIENTGLFANMTGLENLKYLARINHKITEADIKESLERVGLLPNDKRVYRKYSLGMKQRLAIAQAIMEKPDIIMLDEPTNSLDEDGVEMIRNIIITEKERGALILLASHNKEDIRLLCDDIYRISQGSVSVEKEVTYDA